MTIESPVYEWLTREAAEEGLKKGLAEGIKEGIKEGIQEGKKEGIQEGTLQEAYKTVHEILEVRFKTIPASVRKKIKQIKDISQLRELRKQALLVQSMDEFETTALRKP